MAATMKHCVFKCVWSSPLYYLPKDEGLRRRWLRFIFNTVPQQHVATLSLCSRHFADDCFLNWALVLKDGSVPTLFGPPRPSTSLLPATALSHDAVNQSQCYILQHIAIAENVAVPSVAVKSTHICVPAKRHVGCQTEPPEGRSVGTQLSMKTRIKSKATQARVASKDCGVGTLPFPLGRPTLFLQLTTIRRPSKRPRLSLTDEEDGPSQRSSSIVVPEPKDST